MACDLESQWPRTCTLTPPGHPDTNTSATIKYWCNSRARYTAYWLVSLVVEIIPPPALGQAVGCVAVAAAAGAYTHHHKTTTVPCTSRILRSRRNSQTQRVALLWPPTATASMFNSTPCILHASLIRKLATLSLQNVARTIHSKFTVRESHC